MNDREPRMWPAALLAAELAVTVALFPAGEAEMDVFDDGRVRVMPVTVAPLERYVPPELLFRLSPDTVLISTEASGAAAVLDVLPRSRSGK